MARSWCAASGISSSLARTTGAAAASRGLDACTVESGMVGAAMFGLLELAGGPGGDNLIPKMSGSGRCGLLSG